MLVTSWTALDWGLVLLFASASLTLFGVGFALVTREIRANRPPSLTDTLTEYARRIGELEAGRATMASAFEQTQAAVEQSAMLADRHRRRAAQAEKRMAEQDEQRTNDQAEPEAGLSRSEIILAAERRRRERRAG